MIIYSTILKYSFNKEKGTFDIYAKLTDSSKTIIANELEEFNEKCIQLKKNVKTTKWGFESQDKVEKSQDILDEILKTTYPFISQGRRWFDRLRKDNPIVKLKCLPKYVPQGKQDQTTVGVGR